jgi:hypothetical protein
MSTQGATIADLSVSITLVENYQLPPEAIPPNLVNPIASIKYFFGIYIFW